MAFEPRPDSFYSYLTPEGDPGYGHVYIEYVRREMTRLGDFAHDVLAATEFFPYYTHPYISEYSGVQFRRSITRRRMEFFLTEKGIQAPTVEVPSYKTAWAAADAVMRNGVGASIELFREHVSIDGALDLGSLAYQFGLEDRIEQAEADCWRVAQAYVESFNLDGWMDDGMPDQPWLPRNFVGADGTTPKYVRPEDMFDPELFDDFYRYTKRTVDRVGDVVWAWVNQRFIRFMLVKAYVVDTSRGHVLGTGG
ncbi:MAG: hypothetical protein J3T61_00485 [Candidatus Brocadiales bacterium]|nr:hypothetical protein [Candidatus Bathyanammoxibius sp.]